MENQRIIGGSAFGLKNPRYRCFVSTVGTKAVDRFCRKGDKAALCQDMSRLSQHSLIGIRSVY